jgi:FkbM family methyltransferase
MPAWKSTALNGSRSIARFVFGKILPKGYAYPVVRGPLHGIRFVLGAAAGEGGGASVLFGLSEPAQTRAFAAAVKPGHIVFDVGANVGYYTLLGSRLVGAKGLVLSVEPVLRNLQFLNRHLQINGIKNVILLSSACSDKLGIACFHPGENNAVGHLREITDKQTRNLGAVAVVPTVSIDSIASQIGLSPHVIKIDVEGAELRVLQGGKDTLTAGRPDIFLSVHSPDLRQKCLRYLESLDYETVPIDNGSQPPDEYYAVGH